MEEFSFTETVNKFIDSLDQHQDTIKVVKINDRETIIYYEDYEHEPIKNFESVFTIAYRTKSEYLSGINRVNLNRKLSKEHREAIAKGKKGRKHSEEHSANIAKAKREYYQKLRDSKN